MHNLRSQTAQNSLLISNISQQFFRSATKFYISVPNTAATEFNTAFKSPNKHKYIIYTNQYYDTRTISIDKIRPYGLLYLSVGSAAQLNTKNNVSVLMRLFCGTSALLFYYSEVHTPCTNQNSIYRKQSLP